jgi:hypothetical protein
MDAWTRLDGWTAGRTRAKSVSFYEQFRRAFLGSVRQSDPFFISCQSPKIRDIRDIDRDQPSNAGTHSQPDTIHQSVPLLIPHSSFTCDGCGLGLIEVVIDIEIDCLLATGRLQGNK